MAQVKQTSLSAARVFSQQPDRVAAAWRRVRLVQATQGAPAHNLLDDVVEPFIRELGRSLEGAPGSPWARTRGVLRISHERGPGALQAEFFTLLRCLGDALDALGAPPSQQRLIRSAVREGMDSALAHAIHLAEPSLPVPDVSFGGLIVELFERRPTPDTADAAHPVRGVH